MSAAFFMVSQSDWLPMMMATGGLSCGKLTSSVLTR